MLETVSDLIGKWGQGGKMTRTRILIENACYHIYARGNQKQIVFIEKNDFEFYLGQLKHSSTGKTGCSGKII